MPCTKKFRGKVHLLDVKPDLIDRITALDILISIPYLLKQNVSLYQPKSTLGGVLTIVISYVIVTIIAFEISNFVQRSDNYQVTIRAGPPPPLILFFVVQTRG